MTVEGLERMAVLAARHRDRMVARYGAGSFQVRHAERAVAEIAQALAGDGAGGDVTR